MENLIYPALAMIVVVIAILSLFYTRNEQKSYDKFPPNPFEGQKFTHPEDGIVYVYLRGHWAKKKEVKLPTEDCLVEPQAEKPEPKPIRTYDNNYGKYSELDDKFKPNNSLFIFHDESLRDESPLKLDIAGNDRTVLTAKDYALIAHIMSEFEKGHLLFMSTAVYLENHASAEVKDELNLTAGLGYNSFVNSNPYVAITNNETLLAALNHALGLRKSMDSYRRAYSKTI